MVFCCVLYFLSKIVFWQATSFFWFLTERIFLSIVLAGLSGVDTSILYLSCKGKNIQKIFGVYNALQMAGLLTAAAIFALFIRDNYKLSGQLTVISYGIAALLSSGLTEIISEDTQHICAGQFKAILLETLRNRNLLLFLFSAAFLTETHQTITVFLNQVQYEKCGLNNSVIGYIYIISTVAGMCGIWSAKFAKKMGIKAAGIFFCGAAVVPCLTLALSEHTLPSVCSILTLYISNSLFQPFQTEIQNQQIHTKYRATALSVHSMIMDSVAVVTNLSFGALAEYHLTMAFFFGTGICVVSMVLFIIWYKNNTAA